MMDTTDWLDVALAQRPQPEYPWSESEPDDVMPGDIVVVGDMDRLNSNRMMLVLDSYLDRRFFHGVVVTNELSLATANSLILEPEETDLPYRVAVLAGLARYLWFVQVDKRLGAVTEEILQATVATYVGLEDEFQKSRRGVPLQYSGWDLRWPDLENESDYMHDLAQDCTEKSGNGDIGLPYLDPQLINLLMSDLKYILENYDTLSAETCGFSPSCIRETIDSLDKFLLRALPDLFSSQDNPADLSLEDYMDENERLQEYTKADGLLRASFVKIAGRGPEKYERFRNGGRRAEFLYETIGGE